MTRYIKESKKWLILELHEPHNQFHIDRSQA